MESRKNEYDAIVIGGGIVGTSIAYHLVEAGADTLLIDRGDVGQATSAGAGIVAPLISERFPGRAAGFALRAGAYVGALAAALARESAEPTGYARCGLLLVAASEDEGEKFSRALPVILERAGGDGSCRSVQASEAVRLFPALGPVYGALHYRDAARVDGRLLTRALRAAAERRGLTASGENVVELIRERDRIAGVRTERGTLRAGAVALAAGAWSGAFAKTLGVDLRVEPQRGQILHLDLGEPHNSATGGTGDWPIVVGFRDHYIVPWPGGRIVAGATRETGSGFAAQVTAAGVREVLDEALRVAPGLANAELAEIRVGLRPLSLDGLPILGPVPGLESLHLATGHGPSGLTLGPYSGKLIADCILGRERGDGAELEPFSLMRFDGASAPAPQ
ncbi:MAG: FAD-dependent oxidoreductase [Proteobacteria bacterium]|nr:FAD-dependent oxidoreductase [Pseudomonadota bacterium]MCZ6783476.1 FAD-dependent oxidoreductase [Pseudomonadota bacterium]